MSAVAAAADTADGTEAKGGSKKLIIIIAAAVAIVLVAGGLMMKMMMAPKETPKDPAKEKGAVVALKDDMTLNLADGRFLKTQLSLQLSEEATLAAGGEKALANFDGSMARDAAIQILSRYSYNQLLSWRSARPPKWLSRKKCSSGTKAKCCKSISHSSSCNDPITERAASVWSRADDPVSPADAPPSMNSPSLHTNCASYLSDAQAISRSEAL